jgi:uncharacterized protein
MKINSILIQFAIGLLFGFGLVIAGMSNPAKVLNFLDLARIPAGTWDPSLAFVLGGGVITTWLGYRLVLQRPAPIMDTSFHLPQSKSIDPAIIIGPAIFGIGWGTAGLCPGPAFTALGTGTYQPIIFVAAMLVGMLGARSCTTIQNTKTSAKDPG